MFTYFMLLRVLLDTLLSVLHSTDITTLFKLLSLITFCKSNNTQSIDYQNYDLSRRLIVVVMKSKIEQSLVSYYILKGEAQSID